MEKHTPKQGQKAPTDKQVTFQKFVFLIQQLFIEHLLWAMLFFVLDAQEATGNKNSPCTYGILITVG